MEADDTSNVKTILATDCGSTTTKARFFMKIGSEYRFICTGEAPTTVEAPFEDVTLGVRNAVREVEELVGIKMMNKGRINIKSPGKTEGIDLYVTTSSAGGGLQMMVFGVTKSITVESGERAALGGGAIVMDVIVGRDKIPLYKKVERTRYLRPDMVLVAGGTDGGSVAPVVQAAEILRLADPKARFGDTFSLPVIYAGNKTARPQVKRTLEEKFALEIVENLRPRVNMENTDPARDAIQALFMEHVMSHAPGYDKLMTWTEVPIMPTPRGEGTMFQVIAKTRDLNVIGVGLGGATTNIYSVFAGKFVRSVSANLGMSYSICNVMKETGIENILRWLPFDIERQEVVNILSDKMIRPTTIPQTLEELILEHAVAREALRLGFIHHKFLARGLRGVRPAYNLADIFERKVVAMESYIDMLKIDLIGGTGGLLSHAPRRVQSALMLIDGFQPEGITRLVQDSVFMMPHLGVLSSVHSQAAIEIFEKDCLIRLGTCIAPRGLPDERDGQVDFLQVELTLPNGKTQTEKLNFGEIKRISLPFGQRAKATIAPHKQCDVGKGIGKTVTATLEGGEAGIIIDARGRPLSFPEDQNVMKRTLIKWFKDLDMYPKVSLESYQEGLY